MRPWKLLAPALGLALFAALALIVKAGLEANDWIDRCADATSHRYIENDQERNAACR